MAWRAELMIGIAYIDSLYLGTYPGTLMNTSNLYVTALGATTINAGVDADGTKGTIILWPDTTAKGQINIEAADNTGDDIITLTNGNTSAAITVVLPIISGNLQVDGAANLNVGVDDGTLGTLTLWPDTADLGKMVITPADNASDKIITLTTPADSVGDCTFVLPNVSGFLVAGTAQLTLAEVDILDGATLTTNEINLLDGSWASITTVSETGGSGTVEVQLQFKDAAGVNMAVPVSGQFFLADEATGLTHATVDTSVATATNGSVAESGAGHNVISFVTAADGTLGFTITAAADSFWAVFNLPSGLHVITDELITDA